MKKALTLVAVACIGALSMTSCKKDYTCSCDFSTQNDQTISIKNVNKKDAKKACDEAQTTWRIVDANVKCSL